MKSKKLACQKLSTGWCYFGQFLNGVAANFDKQKKNLKSGHNIGTQAYACYGYPCYGLILKFFWFIKVCPYIVENLGKITPPSRQLLASQLFGFHIKRPIRPLKGPSWRFVFYIIIDVAQLLMVQLRKSIRHFFSVYDILQKLCNKQWSTVVQNKVDFGQKRVSSHELFSSRCLCTLINFR